MHNLFSIIAFIYLGFVGQSAFSTDAPSTVSVDAIKQPEVWADQFLVGAKMPDFDLTDQSGHRWTNKILAGAKGYLIFFNRSVVW